MNRCMIGLCVVVFFLLLGDLSVFAQTPDEVYAEQWQASGAENLPESLPPETRALLERLGITGVEATDFSESSPKTWLTELWKLVKELIKKPLTAGSAVMGMVLLYMWVDGMRHTLRTEEVSTVFGAVCSLAACGTVMIPLSDQLEAVHRAMESVSVFMTSFVPVYAGVLISGGQASVAVSFQSMVLYVAELLSWVAGKVVVPLLTVALAFGLTGSLTPELKLGRVGALTGKVAGWILTFGSVLFSGMLSLQSLVGGAADRLGDRALRFSIAQFVPVVGGSISEAFSTIRGCLHVLRSTIGGCGIAATLLIVLPPLITCFIWTVMLTISETAADIGGLSSFSELLKTAKQVLRSLIGILCISGTLLTVAITVVTLAVGGGT